MGKRRKEVGEEKGKRERREGGMRGRREGGRRLWEAYPGKSGADSKVMVDDWHKVFGQLQVKLHIVSSMCSRLPERRYCVLRC